MLYIMEGRVKMKAEWMSTSEVAKKYKVTSREVLYARKRGLLQGIRVGWIWMFPTKDLPKKWPVRQKRKKVS